MNKEELRYHTVRLGLCERQLANAALRAERSARQVEVFKNRIWNVLAYEACLDPESKKYAWLVGGEKQRAFKRA